MKGCYIDLRFVSYFVTTQKQIDDITAYMEHAIRMEAMVKNGGMMRIE